MDDDLVDGASVSLEGLSIYNTHTTQIRSRQHAQWYLPMVSHSAPIFPPNHNHQAPHTNPAPHRQQDDHIPSPSPHLCSSSSPLS
jgi:hypothetical protein